MAGEQLSGQIQYLIQDKWEGGTSGAYNDISFS
jgi:hypothetical protein